MSDAKATKQPMKQITWEKGMYFCGGVGSFYFTEEELDKIIPNYDYGHALAYLWRRFGPPSLGGDSYKDLTHYHLTTAMDGVYLSCNCYLSHHIAFGLGFSGELYEKLMNNESFHKGKCDWPEETKAIWNALLDAIKELKRPVNVRDWFINIEGKVKDEDVLAPVEYSDKAGYGVTDEYYDRFKTSEETNDEPEQS